MASKLFGLLIFIELCCACTHSSDEQQVRAVIDAAEAAAEARSASDVVKLADDEYQDDLGNDKKQLRQFLRGYFLIHPKIELLVRVIDLQIETPNSARAHIDVAMVGTKAIDSRSSLAAEPQSLQFDFKRIGTEWRVVRVEREITGTRAQ